MKILGYVKNRVILGMLLFFVAVGAWEFRFKPQYRPIYEQAIVSYQSKKYDEALEKLKTAYAIAPNAVDVMILIGWVNLKLNEFSEAEYYFGRALRIDPSLEEAHIGASFTALETGRGQINLQLLEDYLGQRGNSPELQILIAEALVRQGSHFQAAEIYLRLSRDRDYGRAARIALTELYGLPEFTDRVPLSFREIDLPKQPRVSFRADEEGIWRLEQSELTPFSVDGIGISPAVPNYYPAKPPRDYRFYDLALRLAADLTPRVVLVHTLMSPSFYYAYSDRAATSGPALLQQIHFGMPPRRDLFDPAFVEEVKAEIRHVVDSVHGRGEVAPTQARSGGIYWHDVSSSVVGFLLGRELEPSVAIRTNLINGGITTYRGNYISIDLASPTEAWFAEMLDYLVDYQTSKYATQTPVSLVNWPPLDPLFHETESSTADEIRFRILRGESIGLPEDIQDDTDVVAIDESKFRISQEFSAGFFATYNVHPYWPDFMTRENEYLTVEDSQGPNAFLGYLKQLRSRIQYPLVIGTFGLPNSMGIGRVHPQGWDQGGHTEDEQAQGLIRLAQNIRESGANGGIIESLFDEWYKTSWLTRPFQIPQDRSTLWLNELEPQSRLGLIGFETRNWKLCDPGNWDDEGFLYRVQNEQSGSGEAANLLSLQGSFDEAFLYLKLNLSPGSLEDAKAKDGKKTLWAFALNTFPDESGYTTLPFTGKSLSTGANFLALIDEKQARLLVAENYYPFQLGLNQTELVLKPPFVTKLEDEGSFTEFQVQINRQRFSRSGEIYAPQVQNWSLLRKASNVDGTAPCESEVIIDHQESSVVLRLPWGKLLVTDPSSLQGFYGVEEERQILTSKLSGIAVSVFELAVDSESEPMNSATVAGSLPPVSGTTIGETAIIKWEGWNSVELQSYSKKSYLRLQEFFAGLDGLDSHAEDRHVPTHLTVALNRPLPE